jgi:hypothetical protein
LKERVMMPIAMILAGVISLTPVPPPWAAMLEHPVLELQQEPYEGFCTVHPEEEECLGKGEKNLERFLDRTPEKILILHPQRRSV